MKFEFKTWSLSKLLSLYERDKINLTPPYQRNDIWSLKQQRHLLDTIAHGMPFPNFFLYKQGHGYEMVDGQQRSRTIIGFLKGVISNESKQVFSDLSLADQRKFKAYKIAVATITNLLPGESMENYYVLVNSTGARLNRPELIKAEYFSSTFLKTIQELSENADWKELDIFTEKSKDRMNDIDFLAEILALIEYGPTEKKEKADELFKAQLEEAKIIALKAKFLATLKIIKNLNHDTPLKITRFRQKNDFYTLFHFIAKHDNMELDTYKYYYQLLLKLAPHITPSQEECEPLMDYALNCVSQSNSKNARDLRYKFFTDLLFNPSSTPNPAQNQILRFYDIPAETPEALVKIESQYTLNTTKLIKS